MALRPYEGGRFEKIGSEEAHTIETFERKVHGTPHREPERQFSSKQYTERRTYGRDENGEIVVKIERDPSDPVRPATPVRPVSPVGDHMSRALLQPIQPLHIPRVDVSNSRHASPRNRHYDEVSPRSASIHMLSPRSAASGSPRSGPLSPKSTSSTASASLPLKKVTKKSRWVSIHDGRPVSPYKETVTYEVAYPDRHSSSSVRSASISPRTSRHPSECAYIMENPLYQD
ncbi:unnamed protein product [Caenorhabditis auriculariae]|uniref:Uncharacterized protein n=1 Tax=Caenorhabditis auriculariae TaxID=2777116 RepID=A0A8S1GQZ0_9PELO|nr:unnamed protein product [Caenorhabditis auriculariae]